MSEEKKPSFRLVQKGNVIVAKRDEPNTEFSPKQILDQIDAIEGGINQGEEQLKKLEQQIPETKKHLEANKEMLKKFNKHREWADNIQRSKVRSIVEEIKAEVLTEVEKMKDDPILTAEQNGLQKYRHYLGKCSMHPKIAAEINNKIMQDMFYNNPAFKNPFSQ